MGDFFNNPEFICGTAIDFYEQSKSRANDIFTKEFKLTYARKLSFPMVAIAFSMELALKGLLMQHNIDFPFKHDLKELYYLLPMEQQNKIVEHYLEHKEFDGFFNMHLSLCDKDRPKMPNRLPPKELNTIDAHIEQLLEKHKSAFPDFRYLHEFGLRKFDLGMDYNYFASLTYSILFVLSFEIGYNHFLKKDGRTN